MEKTMKKSWFNYKLYLDGINQLKIIGIMGAIIMACASFLIPMGYNIENTNYGESVNRVWTVIGRVCSYDILEMNPCIVFTFLAVVPLMTLYLFGYMNKRNACDFYHAIPDTRESLFTSYGAAVLSWNVVLVIESVLISIISAGIFEYVELRPEKVAITVINLIVGCMFMFGVFAIAMSVTGTIFSNLAVAVMILVAPRVIATSYIVFISESNPLITSYGLTGGFFDDRLNVVTNLVTGLVIRGEYEGIYMWRSFVYTLVVGLIYCGFGMWLFKIRKSETATQSAVNNVLQSILRLIPAMLICLLPIVFIFESIIGQYSIDARDIYILAVFYIIAIIAYVLYELITTKKFKNVIKSLPGLVWLLIYNVVMVVAMVIGYNVLLNDIPDVSDVKSVNICLGYYYDDEEIGEYNVDKFSKVDYESEEIKELLVGALKRNVEAVKKNESLYAYESKEDEYNSSILRTVKVTFDEGLFSGERQIYLSRQESVRLMELLSQNEEAKNAIYEVVDFDEVSVITGGNNLSNDTLKNLYLAYMEELKTLDFGQALDITMNGASSSIGSIRIVMKNGKYIAVPMTIELPKTQQLFVDETNKANMADNGINDFIDKYDKGVVAAESAGIDDPFECSGNIYIRTYENGKYLNNVSGYYNIWNDGANEAAISCDFTENGMKILNELAQKLEANKDAKIDLEKRFVMVSYSYTDYITGESKDSYRYYPATEEINELLKEYGGY